MVSHRVGRSGLATATSGLQQPAVRSILNETTRGVDRPQSQTNGSIDGINPGADSMSETIFSSTSVRPTRRQFGRAVASSAVGALAVPAIVRGRNLNEKLNIAMIGVGGRGAANLSQGRLREHRGPLRRVRAGGRPGRGAPSAGPPLSRLPQALRPCPRLRRGRREHDRAHPRLCHPAGLATGQARLLREAADVQHLGGPHHPRGRREGQGRDPDGNPDPRRRQLSPRRGAGPDRSHRAGARGARLGRPGLGPAVEGGGRAASRHRLRDRAAQQRLAGSQGARLGPVARPRAGAAVSTRSTSPGRNGTAGGTSATAP